MNGVRQFKYDFNLNRAANADVNRWNIKNQISGMAFYNGENTNQYAQMSFFNNGTNTP